MFTETGAAVRLNIDERPQARRTLRNAAALCPQSRLPSGDSAEERKQLD